MKVLNVKLKTRFLDTYWRVFKNVHQLKIHCMNTAERPVEMHRVYDTIYTPAYMTELAKEIGNQYEFELDEIQKDDLKKKAMEFYRENSPEEIERGFTSIYTVLQEEAYKIKKSYNEE
jgi:hypothetical protein